MKLRPSLLLILSILLLGLAACQKAEDKPTPTPDQAGIQAASTLFAQPTRAARVTPTPTPLNTVEIDLNRVIARMEQAVLAGDVAGYMAHVWDGDPIFYNDHLHWAEDWQQHPLSVFEIALFSIGTLAPDTATARMYFRWRQVDATGDGSAGGTTVTVVFYRVAGEWKLGGEYWKTAETLGIMLYYFADRVVDDSVQAAAMLDYLPDIYTTLTRAFDFVPDAIAHIRLYDNPATLQNWTRFSRPDISVWNEPGESIKLALTANNTAPYETDTAREYTRFMLYEMSGGSHGGFPWWLEDGVAEYGASLFRTLSQRNRIYKQIAALAVARDVDQDHLIEWSALDDPDELTAEQRTVAVYQAYTLVEFVSQTYGAEARNAWVRAIAGGEAVEAACQAALGVSFADLDAQWRAWLPSLL